MSSEPPVMPTIRVELAMNKELYHADETQELTFAILNDSAYAVNILTWRTPLEGFKSDMFSVRVNGRRVPYLGRAYKRGLPTENDFVNIPANGRVSFTVRLSDAYDI